AAALSTEEHRRNRRSLLAPVLLPGALAVRRAARARIFPVGGRRARPTHGRSDPVAARQATGGRHMAARKHAPRSGTFRARRWRWTPEPVEYAALSACA